MFRVRVTPGGDVCWCFCLILECVVRLLGDFWPPARRTELKLRCSSRQRSAAFRLIYEHACDPIGFWLTPVKKSNIKTSHLHRLAQMLMPLSTIKRLFCTLAFMLQLGASKRNLLHEPLLSFLTCCQPRCWLFRYSGIHSTLLERYYIPLSKFRYRNSRDLS